MFVTRKPFYYSYPLILKLSKTKLPFQKEGALFLYM